MCYNLSYNRLGNSQGWYAHSRLYGPEDKLRVMSCCPILKGGDALSVYQTLMFAVSFAALIVSILSFSQKK